MTRGNGITGYVNAPTLTTWGDHQFAVWYDLAGELHIGRIERGTQTWGVDHDEYTFAGSPRTTLVLPVEDDDHNFCTLAVDGLGLIHVWANMHTDSPIRAVKTTTAHTTDDWLATAGWASAASDFPSIGPNATYPVPTRLADGSLWFWIRDALAGGSEPGNDNSRYWIRGPGASSWTNMGVFTQGDGLAGDSGSNDRTNWGAYVSAPYVEADREPNPGRLHITWVWRIDTTADDWLPGYAYSDDNGTTWKAIDGSTLTMPITPLNSIPARFPGSARITALARASNVVTAEADDANHGIAASDSVTLWAVNGTFDGAFTVTSVGTPNSTSIRWAQTAADNASGGAGCLARADCLYVNSPSVGVDNAGSPHIFSTASGFRVHIYRSGGNWVQDALPNPNAGTIMQSRIGACFWLRDVLWYMASGRRSTIVNSSSRQHTLWRVDGAASIRLGPDQGFQDHNWEPTPDPEAWRRFGIIETLSCDGDTPRVFTFGNNARIKAAA